MLPPWQDNPEEKIYAAILLLLPGYQPGEENRLQGKLDGQNTDLVSVG
jgi:hypothetical protein